LTELFTEHTSDFAVFLQRQSIEETYVVVMRCGIFIGRVSAALLSYACSGEAFHPQQFVSAGPPSATKPGRFLAR